VLLDQRGAGKSRPSAELAENTSQLLVQDIETLRQRLGVRKWHAVFGGSWGSTLALLYTQTHPEAVGSLILRGIHLGRQSDFAWSRGSNGARNLYPDAYDAFVGHLPAEDREDPYQGYYKLLTSPDREVQVAAAKSWNRWDLTIGSLNPSEASFSKLDDEEWCLSHARLEAHYFVHDDWLEEGQLLKPENLSRATHIPRRLFSTWAHSFLLAVSLVRS
jgi:proline iminopeptidase